MVWHSPDHPGGLGQAGYHLSNVKFNHETVTVALTANVGAVFLIAREVGDKIMHHLSLRAVKPELAQLVPYATEIVDNHHLEIPSLVRSSAK
jgi:hypothetical protein